MPHKLWVFGLRSPCGFPKTVVLALSLLGKTVQASDWQALGLSDVSLSQCLWK